jgi:hypothetical protein
MTIATTLFVEHFNAIFPHLLCHVHNGLYRAINGNGCRIIVPYGVTEQVFFGCLADHDEGVVHFLRRATPQIISALSCNGDDNINAIELYSRANHPTNSKEELNRYIRRYQSLLGLGFHPAFRCEDGTVNLLGPEAHFAVCDNDQPSVVFA